jgi:hypothetical protein
MYPQWAKSEGRWSEILDMCTAVELPRRKAKSHKATVWSTIRMHGLAKEGPFVGFPTDASFKFMFENVEGVGWQLTVAKAVRGFETIGF